MRLAQRRRGSTKQADLCLCAACLDKSRFFTAFLILQCVGCDLLGVKYDYVFKLCHHLLPICVGSFDVSLFLAIIAADDVALIVRQFHNDYGSFDMVCETATAFVTQSLLKIMLVLLTTGCFRSWQLPTYVLSENNSEPGLDLAQVVLWPGQ